MTKDINKIIAELERRKKFFDSELSRLRGESLFEDRPSRRFDIEERKREAIKELEVTQELIDKAKDFSKNNTSLPQNQAQAKNLTSTRTDEKQSKTSASEVANSTQGGGDRPTHDWYKKPIGIIGLTVFSGILIVMAVYFIKTHFGIPL